jgi:hypothetical protein
LRSSRGTPSSSSSIGSVGSSQQGGAVSTLESPHVNGTQQQVRHTYSKSGGCAAAAGECMLYKVLYRLPTSRDCLAHAPHAQHQTTCFEACTTLMHCLPCLTHTCKACTYGMYCNFMAESTSF